MNAYVCLNFCQILFGADTFWSEPEPEPEPPKRFARSRSRSRSRKKRAAPAPKRDEIVEK